MPDDAPTTNACFQTTSMLDLRIHPALLPVKLPASSMLLSPTESDSAGGLPPAAESPAGRALLGQIGLHSSLRSSPMPTAWRCDRSHWGGVNGLTVRCLSARYSPLENRR